jgi:hypothetical protein
VDGLVDLLELAGEIAGRRGDGGDAEGGAVPNDAVVEFGNGEVEAVTELVFHGADHLAAVFKGLSVRDFDLDGEFGDWHVSADEHQVGGHADANGGEDEAEDEGVPGDATGLPGSGAQLADELDVTKGCGEGDDDAESDEGDSGPEGDASGVDAGGEVRFSGGDLAKEEAEAANGEANAHEGEAGANPGEEGSLGREIDSGILLDRLVGWAHGGIV